MDNGYYQIYQKGTGQCLSYDQDFNIILENCTPSNDNQQWVIEETYGTIPDDETRGMYEIMTKNDNHQIFLNKNVIADGIPFLLQPGTITCDESKYWTFTNFTGECRLECKEEKVGCNTETFCETICREQ